MKVMQVLCGSCAGMGKHTNWKIVDESTIKSEEAICEVCNGNGYTDYAIFTLEEAKAILKHCGLSVES